MKLSIITPQSQEHYIVEWIQAHTPQGSIVIKQGHAPIILTLVAHQALSFLIKAGEEKMVMLDRPGFLEVNRTEVIALINQNK